MTDPALRDTNTETTSDDRAPVLRVSTLELFFDLVFVFAITQVAHLFGHAHGVVDLVRAFLVLAVVWWMYGGYAWLTSNVGTDRLSYRLVLLCGMAAFLVMALRIPGVADRHGAAFGLAYIVAVLVHAVLFAHAPNSSARAILPLLPFNLSLGVFVLASGLVSQSWNWVPWVAAGLAIAASTLARRERGFHLSPHHFVERHGLVVLIALGESVVVIGTGAADRPLTLALLSAVVLGLALAAALWWAYFDGDDERAEHAMMRAEPVERAHLGLYGYYYAHLVMIAGIVVAAAGMQPALASSAHVEPSESAATATGWLLSGGVALYLIGSALFRWLLRTGPARGRIAAAVVALALSPLGIVAGSLVHLTSVVLVLILMLVAERRVLRASALAPHASHVQ